MTAIMYTVTVYPHNGNSWTLRRDTWQDAQDDAQTLARLHVGRATVKQIKVTV